MKEGEKEYIKEAITTIRVFAALVVTGIFGASGFIVSNINTIDQKQFIMSVAGLVALFVFFCFAVYYFFKMMGELEKSDD